MNKRGQVIGGTFALIMFVIIWFLWLGSWVNEWGARFVATNSLTGIEAFLAANLQLWILLGVSLSYLAILYFGGAR